MPKEDINFMEWLVLKKERSLAAEGMLDFATWDQNKNDQLTHRAVMQFLSGPYNTF